MHRVYLKDEIVEDGRLIDVPCESPLIVKVRFVRTQVMTYVDGI